MRNKNEWAKLMIFYGSLFVIMGIVTSFFGAAISYAEQVSISKSLGIYIAVLVVSGAILVSAGALLGATVWRERS